MRIAARIQNAFVDNRPTIWTVLIGIVLVVGVWIGIAWVIGEVSQSPEVRSTTDKMTSWQWIAVAAIVVVWLKDFPKSELRDIAKALDKIAEEMRRSRTGIKY